MTIAILMILAGFALLVYGGNVLLKGAVMLASLLKLTPALIGLTVVAAATSVPELAVSIIAAFQGEADIAVGNVVGSNVLNITLILGIAALINPLSITGNTIRLEYPVLLLSTFLFVVISQDLTVSRLEGGFFIVSFVIFIAYVVALVREQITKEESKELTSELNDLGARPESFGKAALLLIAGIVLLGVGAQLAVQGSVTVATIVGISERVIGLTIVAIGTSLPEIVTSVVAGLKKQSEVAVANLVGSNIFNALAIIGLSALVTPLKVSQGIVSSDNWWMLATALLIFPLMYTGRRVVRLEGALLLVVYSIYLSTLLA